MRLRVLRRAWRRLSGVGPHSVRPFEEYPSTPGLVRKDSIDSYEAISSCFKEERGQLFSLPVASCRLETLYFRGDRYRPGGSFVEPDRRAFIVDEAGVVGANGCVYRARTRVAIAESFREWQIPLRDSPVLLSRRLAPPVRLPGLTISAVTLAAEGYYHFLHELVPKLLWLRDQWEKASFVIVNESAGGMAEKWLEYYGLSPQKMRFSGGNGHHFCDEAIFCNHVVYDYQPNPWSLSLLRQSRHETAGEKPRGRWIWATRAGCAARDLKWEREILGRFPQFEVVDFANSDPRETVEAMDQCDCFAGPHGASFANIVFCRPGTRVIEIFPSGTDLRLLYQRMSALCGLDHQVLAVPFDADVSGSTLHQSLQKVMASVEGYLRP